MNDQLEKRGDKLIPEDISYTSQESLFARFSPYIEKGLITFEQAQEAAKKVTKTQMDYLEIFTLFDAGRFVPMTEILECTAQDTNFQKVFQYLLSLQEYLKNFYLVEDKKHLGLSLKQTLLLTEQEVLNLCHFKFKKNHGYTIEEIKQFTSEKIEEIDVIERTGGSLRELSKYTGIAVQNLLYLEKNSDTYLLLLTRPGLLQPYLENWRDNNEHPKLDIDQMFSLSDQSVSNLFNLYVYIKAGYISMKDAIGYSKEEMVYDSLPYLKPSAALEIVEEAWNGNSRSQSRCCIL